MVPDFLYPATVGLPIEKLADILAKFPGAELQRYGGTLRIAAGDPQGRGGWLVGFLRDVAPMTADLAPKLASIQGAAQLAATFSGVAAATGVLNLGVSAVGFAVMNARLNRLHQDLTRFASRIETGINGLASGLESLSETVLDIRLTTTCIRHELAELRDLVGEMDRKQDAHRHAELAPVFRRLEENGGPHDEADLRALLDRIDVYESWLKLLLTPNSYESWGSPGLVRDLGRLQALAMAAALRARLLRSAGRTSDASASLDTGLESLRESARPCLEQLTDPTPAVFLFPESRESVTPAMVQRWMRFVDERSIPAHRVLPILLQERGDRLSKRSLTPQKFAQQNPPDVLAARATAVERLVGTLERLETFRLELEVCETHGLAPARWERIPLEGSESGLYVLPVSRVPLSGERVC